MQHLSGQRTTSICLTYSIAAGAGYAASAIEVPLPWMLGPVFVVGLCSIVFGGLRPAPMGRELGQLVIGLGIGMRLTPEVAATTTGLATAIAASTACVLILTMLAALIFVRLAAVDHATAFFATTAGGMAESSVVAGKQGADDRAVAVAHALRVFSIVAVIPLLVGTYGHSGTTVGDAANSDLQLVLPILGVAAVLAAWLRAKAKGLPNPFLLAPIFLGAALSASGFLTLSIPSFLLIVAQIAVGTWVGCRFNRSTLIELPRVVFAGTIVSIMMIVIAAGGALLLAQFTEIPFPVAFLALAPGALAEMVLTAIALNFSPEIVTAFHLPRLIFINATLVMAYYAYQRVVVGGAGAVGGVFGGAFGMPWAPFLVASPLAALILFAGDRVLPSDEQFRRQINTAMLTVVELAQWQDRQRQQLATLTAIVENSAAKAAAENGAQGGVTLSAGQISPAPPGIIPVALGRAPVTNGEPSSAMQQGTPGTLSAGSGSTLGTTGVADLAQAQEALQRANAGLIELALKLRALAAGDYRREEHIAHNGSVKD